MLTGTLNTHRKPARLAAMAVAAIAALVATQQDARAAATQEAHAAATQPPLALSAAIPAPTEGGAGAMVEIYARRPGDHRVLLRAIVSGAQPGSSLRLIASKRSCAAASRSPRAALTLWSGTADADGNARAGFGKLERLRLPGGARLGSIRVLGIGNPHYEDFPLRAGCARTRALRALQPGSRPQVITSTLADGGDVHGMMAMNMDFVGGVATLRVISRFTGVQDGSYTLLACGIGTIGCPQSGKFRLEIAGIDCLKSVCTARSRLDRRAVRAITRNAFQLAMQTADPSDDPPVPGGLAAKWQGPDLDASKNE